MSLAVQRGGGGGGGLAWEQASFVPRPVLCRLQYNGGGGGISLGTS